MSRIERTSVGDYVYHVLNRANARVSVFDNEKDYVTFEAILEDAVVKYDMINGVSHNSLEFVADPIFCPKAAAMAKSIFFALKVKTGAEYDIKSTSFSKKVTQHQTVPFEGWNFAPEDFGNYNYGVAAKAMGFSLTYAKFGAGMSQTFLQGSNEWSNWRGFFDQTRDTFMIEAGYNRFK